MHPTHDDSMLSQKAAENGAPGVAVVPTDFTAYVNSLYDQTLNWEDIKWLRSITSLPIVLKGIVRGILRHIS